MPPSILKIGPTNMPEMKNISCKPMSVKFEGQFYHMNPKGVPVTFLKEIHSTQAWKCITLDQTAACTKQISLTNNTKMSRNET